MLFNTYILRSQKHHGYYVGYCKNVQKRLLEHNRGMTKSTKNGIPWVVVKIEVFQTRPEAMRREKQIKRYKGGEALRSC